MIKEIIIIFLIFILPIILINIKIIPKKHYLILLGIILSIAIILTVYEKSSLEELGIRFDNFKSSIIPHLLFTLLGTILIIVFAKINGAKIIKEFWKDSHFKYLFLIISFSQVYLFLGYLMPKLNIITANIWISILINGIIFTLVHLIYKDFFRVMPLLVLGGIGFATVYSFYPNLILAGISHSVLNFVIVLYGYLSKLE